MFKTIKNRKLKIAVVGCGRISRNHFGSIQQHSDDFELIAVCDNVTSVLEQHTKDYKVPGYKRLEELLQNEKPDLISLCSPSGIHPDQAALAAKYSVHVITEKPMATRWSDGVRMVKACDEAGVRLFVVKQNRRNTTLQLLKRAVSEKRFGKIHMVHLNVFWTRPQAYYDSAKWRGTWEFDGGAFMNQAGQSLCRLAGVVDWAGG